MGHWQMAFVSDIATLVSVKLCKMTLEKLTQCFGDSLLHLLFNSSAVLLYGEKKVIMKVN